MTSISDVAIHGTSSEHFEWVKQVFADLWLDIEVGASLAIFKDNELIVNLHGGYTDRNGEHPWRAETIVNTYSTAKGITSMAIACLVDEGLLDYTAPVAEYWPEFGAENKFDITVTQALSHQAGLYTFQPVVEVESLYDWQAMTFNIASQKPAWPSGSGFGYHSITWGYIAGELIRRITGRSPGDYIHDRIAKPLKADIHLGVRTEDLPRCADLIGPNHARKTLDREPRPEGERQFRSQDPTLTPFRDVCSDNWRQAEIPASNLHATALGLAECYRAYVNDEIVSKETRAASTQEITRGDIDLCFGRHIRRSRGFILNCGDCYCGPAPEAFGHSGTGGSVAFADPVHNIAFAYVMNQLDNQGPRRYRKLVNALYQSIESTASKD